MKKLSIEYALFSFLVLVIVSFFLFIAFVIFGNVYALNNQQTAAGTQIKANTEQLETYQYKITAIDKEGIHGKSINDNTGIFLTYEVVEQNKLTLKENDKISVSFPVDDYETITKVIKIN